MENKDILVPYDGSSQANLALYYALDLAKLIGDGIVLLHIIKSEKYGRDAKIQAARVLRDAKRKADENGVECRVHLAVGDPAKKIIEESEKADFRQIVMGSRGKSGLGGMVVGSVAGKVIQKSKIPVTVVK